MSCARLVRRMRGQPAHGRRRSGPDATGRSSGHARWDQTGGRTGPGRGGSVPPDRVWSIRPAGPRRRFPSDSGVPLDEPDDGRSSRGRARPGRNLSETPVHRWGRPLSTVSGAGLESPRRSHRGRTAGAERWLPHRLSPPALSVAPSVGQSVDDPQSRPDVSPGPGEPTTGWPSPSSSTSIRIWWGSCSRPRWRRQRRRAGPSSMPTRWR